MEGTGSLELAWSNDYELGHYAIDQQHRYLFSLYNRLLEAFSNGSGYLIIDAAVEDLLAYTRVHFQEEESLMERAGYPHLEAHRAGHRRMIAQVEAFAEELEREQLILSHDLLMFVRTWLRQHILHDDQHLKPLLAA